ncbi:hypothetical protein Tco_1458879 [Tanacetum coccineum]
MIFGTYPLPSNESWPNQSGGEMNYLHGSCTELFAIKVFLEEETKKTQNTPVAVFLFKLDMTSIKWEELERLKDWEIINENFVELDVEDIFKYDRLWEEIDDLKDGIFCLDLARDHLLSFSRVTASELGGFIHIRCLMGETIYSYHVKDNTISPWYIPSQMLPASDASMWKCRLEDDHGEILLRLGTDDRVGFNESHLLNIPSDLLESIMEHCVGVEYMNFRATCKRCHLAAPLIKWSNKRSIKRLQTYSAVSPWLMVVDKKQDMITFIDPVFGDNYFKKISQISIFRNKIFCSSFGWLLFEYDVSFYVLYNPFTNDIRKLPESRDPFKSLSFSAPPTAANCIVVGFKTAEHWRALIHFVNREPVWHTLNHGPDPHTICSSIFDGRDLYALGKEGELIVFNNLGQPDHLWKLVEAEAPKSCSSSTQKYLTKCDQQLLLVSVGKNGEHVELFEMRAGLLLGGTLGAGAGRWFGWSCGGLEWSWGGEWTGLIFSGQRYGCGQSRSLGGHKGVRYGKLALRIVGEFGVVDWEAISGESDIGEWCWFCDIWSSCHPGGWGGGRGSFLPGAYERWGFKACRAWVINRQAGGRMGRDRQCYRSCRVAIERWDWAAFGLKFNSGCVVSRVSFGGYCCVLGGRCVAEWHKNVSDSLPPPGGSKVWVIATLCNQRVILGVMGGVVPGKRDRFVWDGECVAICSTEGGGERFAHFLRGVSQRRGFRGGMVLGERMRCRAHPYPRGAACAGERTVSGHALFAPDAGPPEGGTNGSRSSKRAVRVSVPSRSDYGSVIVVVDRRMTYLACSCYGPLGLAHAPVLNFTMAFAGFLWAGCGSGRGPNNLGLRGPWVWDGGKNWGERGWGGVSVVGSGRGWEGGEVDEGVSVGGVWGLECGDSEVGRGGGATGGSPPDSGVKAVVMIAKLKSLLKSRDRDGGRKTKNHPLANVIGDPSRSVSTRKELKTDVMWCYFDAFLTSVEPNNIKEAMLESFWIEAMQEEIHEFERL